MNSERASAAGDRVDLFLSQLEVSLLREELESATPRIEFPPPENHPAPGVIDSRRADRRIGRLMAENRGLRELLGVWRALAIAAGMTMLLLIWNVLSRSG